MVNWTNIFRWIHVLAGAAWFGEVVVINFVLLPALSKLKPAARGQFIALVFPRIFKLASVLAAVTLLAGLVLNYRMTGWQQLSIFVTGRWGPALLAGGLLGLGLALFHFFAEGRLGPQALSLGEEPDEKTLAVIHRRLQIIPRVGMGIMVAILILMMYAARGI